MSSAIQKLEVFKKSDSKKLARVVYEDGTEAEFTIDSNQGYFITVKNKGEKHIGKTHFKGSDCKGLKMSSYHRITEIREEVTCALCKKYLDRIC